MTKGLLSDTETQPDDVQLSPMQYTKQTNLMGGIIILFPAGFWTQTFGAWQTWMFYYLAHKHHIVGNFHKLRKFLPHQNFPLYRYICIHIKTEFEQVVTRYQKILLLYFKSAMDSIWHLKLCSISARSTLPRSTVAFCLCTSLNKAPRNLKLNVYSKETASQRRCLLTAYSKNSYSYSLPDCGCQRVSL